MGRSGRDNGGFRNQRQNGHEHMASEGSYGGRPQADRAPLQWAEAETLTVGQVTATISTAQGGRGDKLYSFVVGRIGREPGRTSKFFQPRDTKDLVQLMEQVAIWVDADRGGQQRAEA